MVAERYQVGPTRFTDARDIPQGLELTRVARDTGMTLSAYLEEINPSREGDDMDAYERQLLRYNIRTQDDTRTGIPASTVGDFFKPTAFDGQTPLARDDWGTERFASNQPQSWALFPEFINRIMRVQPLADDVLDDLVAVTTTIVGTAAQTIYLQDTVASRRMSRVAENAEIPRIFAKLNFQATVLFKYGLALEMTYEVLRRIRLPIFTVIIERVRAQIRQDEAAQAVDVLVNGDGNNNAATNYNVSTLDPTALAGPGVVTDPYLQRIGDPAAASTIAKKISYPAFLQWRTSLYPLGMTTIVGRMNEIIQLLTLQMPSINPTLLLGLLEGGPGTQMGRLELPDSEIWGNAKLVYLPYAPGGMLVGLNKNSALEMLLEEGSDIAESDKDILHQRNFLTVTQNTGFDKIISSAVSTLSLQ